MLSVDILSLNFAKFLDPRGGGVPEDQLIDGLLLRRLIQSKDQNETSCKSLPVNRWDATTQHVRIVDLRQQEVLDGDRINRLARDERFNRDLQVDTTGKKRRINFKISYRLKNPMRYLFGPNGRMTKKNWGTMPILSMSLSMKEGRALEPMALV